MSRNLIRFWADVHQQALLRNQRTDVKVLVVTGRGIDSIPGGPGAHASAADPRHQPRLSSGGFLGGPWVLPLRQSPRCSRIHPTGCSPPSSRRGAGRCCAGVAGSGAKPRIAVERVGGAGGPHPRAARQFGPLHVGLDHGKLPGQLPGSRQGQPLLCGWLPGGFRHRG